MKNNLQPIETYFQDLRDIRQSGGGVEEASYYGSLEKLLNEIGKTIQPQVRCIIQLKNRGAGHPDGGLFTKDQWEHGDVQTPLLGQIPGRGVIEIKPTDDDTLGTASGEQVSKYWKTYQLVLVTNFRDFVLVGKDDKGKPFNLETYHLGASEVDFWTQTLHPKYFAKEKGATFSEYLRRTMLHAAPVSSPKDLAWLLASYARTASAIIAEKDIPVMNSVRAALEAGLGIKFEGKKGEHFFRSTLVQTIFYGLFSAWVLWSKNRTRKSTDIFSWREAVWELNVPVMQALFEQIVTPSHVGTLEFKDILELASSTLNRVDRTSFFNTFEDDKAVQYFYEPFLEAFDPELRKQFGVWFTPSEIVQYMVARVDTVLKQELNIPDGLADPSVFVLDPCCGTGSYIVEVLKRIHQTLKSKSNDALIANDLKQAALKRVFGFEILPAPFVVSHMQLGFVLQNLGVPLSETEHAGVYLTNALTGWEPLDPEKEKAFQGMLLGFPKLLEEQLSASKVKQKVPILVILGNPPYDAFAGTAATKEERESVAPYKKGLRDKWGIKKYNLDELYVRFFRMAEHRIAEQTGRGVVCFISNYSWTEEPSFVVLRQHLLESFDNFWIENLHGNRKISEYAPNGKTSETIFAIPGFSVGIQQGVATSLWVKKEHKSAEQKIYFRDDLQASRAHERRKQLIDSLEVEDFNSHYQVCRPSEKNRYLFCPSDVSANFLSWPQLTEFALHQPFAGMSEDRRKALINIEGQILKDRMQKYFDPNVSWEELNFLKTSLTTDLPRFNAKKAREILTNKETFNDSRIIRYAMRPFDLQWCYYSPIRPLWREPRPEYWATVPSGTPAIVTRFKSVKPIEGPPLIYTKHFCDYHMMPPNSSIIPMALRTHKINNNKPKEQAHLIQLEETEPDHANLSMLAQNYLTSLGFSNVDVDTHVANLIWMHTLAIGYSPAYLQENADGIRKNWPRIPLPNTKPLLESSSTLGEKLAALLDTEQSVIGVTTAPIMPMIKNIGVITRFGGGQLQPKDLVANIGWGHYGRDNVVMPGKGKVIRREYTSEESQSLTSGAANLGISPEKMFALLGDRTLDIYLNEVAYWKNIPTKVWEYSIGGYQVIKKWLSYREDTFLGRPLSTDEAREVRDMARRISAVILLQPVLDENYHLCKENVYSWKSVVG